jgi:hypothetical protein
MTCDMIDELRCCIFFFLIFRMVDAIEISEAFIGQIHSATLEWAIHRLFLPN